MKPGCAIGGDELDRLSIHSFPPGQIIDSRGRTCRDARLFPGGAQDRDWRRPGTRRDPGIQAADLGGRQQ